VKRINISILSLITIFTLSLQGDESDLLLDGFDDTPIESTDTNSTTEVNNITENVESNSILDGFTGKITQQVAYSFDTAEPHQDISSFKTSLFLDYEDKFDNGFRFKTNAKAYYDAIYDIRGKEKYSSQELDELKDEVELFDAYLEGSLTEQLDFKIGRQVLIWGRSDTIRVTDILNPLDNRRPAMVDIEDLRLPVTMAKLDYFIGDWRITPIAILEQRFSKNPPFGSPFSPAPAPMPEDEDYSDITYALSIGGEFSGWDINFYGARVYNDIGVVNPTLNIEHKKINMYGTALNILSGSWLFKSELAYFDGLEYFSTKDESFSRADMLIGFEYKGIVDTLISYDFAIRHINDWDSKLLNEFNPIEEDTYQNAFRISSDFLNATLTGNYLISLYGKSLDEGGFQRLWFKYQIADGINANIGVVDYIGGSRLFDGVKDNDMVYADISYSF